MEKKKRPPDQTLENMKKAKSQHQNSLAGGRPGPPFHEWGEMKGEKKRGGSVWKIRRFLHARKKKTFLWVRRRGQTASEHASTKVGGGEPGGGVNIHPKEKSRSKDQRKSGRNECVWG